MSNFMVQFLAVIIGWSAVVLVAYFIVRWCLIDNFSWKKVVSWVSYITVAIFGMSILYHFLPLSWQDFFSVIVNHLICSIAVHTLFFSADNYLKNKYSRGIPKAKLYFGVLFLYGLMALDTLVVIKLGSHTVAQIAQAAITYLTRGSILMSLVLQIRLRGIPTPESVDSFLEDY